MVESRNAEKDPNPKTWTLEDGIAERRKIPRNPKRRNEGISPEILKGGIMEIPQYPKRSLGKWKKQGVCETPFRSKMTTFVVVKNLLLDFYYQFSCSICILQSNKVTESTISKWKVVSRRHSVTLCWHSEVDPKSHRSAEVKDRKSWVPCIVQKQVFSLKYISIPWESNKITVNIRSGTCQARDRFDS